MKINIFKNRVFMYAILLSAVWHIFWLSIVHVSVVPKVSRQAKFSGVSFLGPILDRGALKLSVGSHEREALEGRYLENIGILPLKMVNGSAGSDYARIGPDEGVSLIDDEVLEALAIEAIDTQKIEPGRDID